MLGIVSMMHHPTHAFDLLLPSEESPRHSQRFESVRIKRPHVDWADHGEGSLLWSINGTALLDGSITSYPENQLEAVFQVAEHLVERVDAEVNIRGTVVWFAVWRMPDRSTMLQVTAKIAGQTSVSNLADVKVDAVDCVRAMLDGLKELIACLPDRPPLRAGATVEAPRTKTVLLSRHRQLTEKARAKRWIV